MVEYSLPTLNRLRVNSGKAELASWKGSKAKLTELIDGLIKEGFTDALPGANVKAKPVPPAEAPELAAPFVKEKAKKAKKEKFEELPETPPRPPEPVVPKEKRPAAVLARGLEGESMARQSRIAAAEERKRVRMEEKEEQKAIKDAAKADKPKKDKKKKKNKGEVDAKKEPEKAKRQQEHIAEKKAKREKEGKVPKSKAGKDEITVADIARDLGIDPKVARAKLRRHEAKLAPLHTKGQDRWVFPASAAKEIKAILK